MGRKTTQNTHWRIMNVISSSKTSPKCNCGSWKQHWINFTSRPWPKNCGVFGCGKPAIHGGHIQINDGRSGNHWYILPMCGTCNGQKGNFDGFVDNRTQFVWANQSKTCQTW